YGRGARALRRGMVPGGSGGGDDRLLPGLGEAVAEGGRGQASSDPGQDAGDLGGAGFLSRLRPRRAPRGRRAQPRPRGAPGGCVALGPSRRGGARQPAADRLLRCVTSFWSAFSSITSVPSSSAFPSLEPGLSPAITKSVFLETELTTFPPASLISLVACSRLR